MELKSFPEDEDDEDVLMEEFGRSRLGGKPHFIQNEEYPKDRENWFFLAELNDLPFETNFGDGGTAYAFVNKAGNQGYFLWQCF